MKNRYLTTLGATAVSLAMILSISTAQSADVYLQAGSYQKTVQLDATTDVSITMWGYSQCTGTAGVFDDGSCAAPSSPGPQITVPVGESLTVYLSNALPDPTSIMIAGQANAPLPVAPVRDADRRLKSFVPEVAAGAVGTYTWTNLNPGAYLYQSGSHVQLQVQMGLYGAMVQDSACTVAGGTCAYPDDPYDAQEVLVFSEIDPALHDPAPTPANATVTGYVPRIFLINGEPFDRTTTTAPVAVPGETVLLRLINAGLLNYAPQLLGGYVNVIAEDGRRSLTNRSQYSLFLPAAKSLDVLFTPTAAGVYTLFDRRLHLVNDTVRGGGMFHQVVVQ